MPDTTSRGGQLVEPGLAGDADHERRLTASYEAWTLAHDLALNTNSRSLTRTQLLASIDAYSRQPGDVAYLPPEMEVSVREDLASSAGVSEQELLRVWKWWVATGRHVQRVAAES